MKILERISALPPLNVLNIGTAIFGAIFLWQITQNIIKVQNAPQEVIKKNQLRTLDQASHVTESILKIMDDPEEIITVDPRLGDIFHSLEKFESTKGEILRPPPSDIPDTLQSSPEYVKYWLEKRGGKDQLPEESLDTIRKYLDLLIQREERYPAAGAILEQTVSQEGYNALLQRIKTEFTFSHTISSNGVDMARLYFSGNEHQVESYTTINRNSEACWACHGYDAGRVLFIHTTKDVGDLIQKETLSIRQNVKQQLWMLFGVAMLYILLFTLIRASIQKQEEQQVTIQNNEERYRSLIGTASDAIMSVDQNGNIVSWNNTAENIFGYSEKEILGRKITTIIPQKYRKGHRNAFAEAVRTGHSSIIEEKKTVETLTGLRKNGEEFPMGLTLATWETAEGRFFTGIIRDITERKAAEIEMMRMALFAEHNPSPVFRINTEGIITLANKPAIKLLKIGTKKHPLVTDLLPEVKKFNFPSIIEKEALRTFEYKEKGQTFHFTVKGSREIERAHIYGTDVTKIKELTEELQNYKNHNEDELAIARNVLESELPEPVISTENFSLAYDFKPMKQIGGDIIKYKALPGNRILVGLADASGHGIPATLIALKFTARFKKAISILTKSPDKNPTEVLNSILNELNAELEKETPEESYLTAILLLIDCNEGKLYMVNAAHPPVFHLKSTNGEVERLWSTRGTIGLLTETTEELSEHTTQTHVLPFDDNDALFLYSDGLTEAENEAGKMLTTDGLEKMLHSMASLQPEEMVQKTMQNLVHYKGSENHEFEDDLSLLAIKLKKRK